MSFCTRLRHSSTARSKSSDTRRFSALGLRTGRALAGSKDVRLGGVAKGRMEIALLGLGTEKRDQTLLILSWGGTGFFFFDDLALNGGGGA